jgi:two-component system, sensor histidine kinase and response regulator
MLWQDSEEVQVMQVGVFDLEGAMGRLEGDEALFREIIQFFLEDSPGLLDNLRCGMRDQDASMIEHAAHSLKSMAANFSAHRAVEAASHLESLGASGNLDEVPRAIMAIEEEINILKIALTPYLYVDGRHAGPPSPS